MNDQIDALKGLQMALARLGYYTGAIDGLFGPRTEAALEAVANEGGAIRNLKPEVAAAGRPMIYQGSARYPVDEIVIHCAATHPDWMQGHPFTAKRKEIDRWHREERGWRKIGYHHLIDRDGTILPGRAKSEIGAGVEGHNRGVIHICLIGGAGSAATDPFERNFTAAQDRALRGLIDAIRAETAITRITGHNDHAAKACPGFIVRSWINRA
ncbi:N-acetylmuramoyl-L-alanine amidase [Rhodobacter capsulatus]|uniref:peptidoglycan recognition protein family protein n=1 Tax=Rhodobacter capsulatus TaxID=1061 RepID=UPI0003D2D32C|nr:N-acetylmuramoyl-L-alanine amidase [Rhodobacter capsulatus]ETD90895.1 N-acetylmuramoyl-L-alanine amidase [Rhodobacter capsulatus YW2]